MSRTLLFKRISKLLNATAVANRRGLSEEQVSEMIDPGRRDFLKKSGMGVAGLAAVTTLAPVQSMARTLAGRQPTVLILGAGAAGLAAAYTLHKAGVPFKIIDANKAGRFGRIFTKQNFNGDGQYVEMGAELVDTGHKTLIGLARELGLEVEAFVDGDKDVDSEIFFFDGRTYTQSEFIEGARGLLTKIADLKAQIVPSEDVSMCYQDADKLPEIAKTYDQMSLAEFLDAQTDVDKWVREAIRVAYTGEYGSEASAQPAYNLFYTIDTDPDTDGFAMFGESDEAFRIKGGSMTLPAALFDRITRKGQLATNNGADRNAVAYYEHSLVKIEDDGKKIHCYFVSADSSRTTLKVSADQVICTIPFSILRNVEGIEKLDLSPTKQLAIAKFGYGTNSKVMMSFASRFWRRELGGVPAHTGSMFVDGGAQAFWETSRLQRGSKGILTNFLGGEAGLKTNNIDVFGARVEVNESVLRALATLNKIYPRWASGQFEKIVAVANWSKVPTARGSYASLAPGQFLTIYGAAGESELDGRLLFAGEHASTNFQGFMEGAFETGVRAAEEILEARGLKKKAG